MAATTAVAIQDLLATRLYLDRQWELDEFEVLFRSFNDLYRLIALFSAEERHISPFFHVPVPFHRRRLNRVAHEQRIPALRVLRITYSSPGHIDLLGIGKIAEITKDTIFGIADRIMGRVDRELDRDRKFLENQAIQIENDRAAVALSTEMLEAAAKGLDLVEKMLALTRENGAPHEDISKMAAGFIAKVEPVIPLILAGKLLAKPSSEGRALTN